VNEPERANERMKNGKSDKTRAAWLENENTNCILHA
jgi:hypothetical protein